MAEPRRAKRRAASSGYPFSPQLHKGLLHERQRTGHLSDRGAIGGGTDADGHCLAGERAGVLDDELVRQGCCAERFSDTAKRLLVGNRERDDDRWRVAGCLAGGVSCLGDLRTMREVSPN